MSNSVGSTRPDAVKKPTPFLRWLSGAVRLALMGVVLYLGWGTYRGYRDMLSGPGPKGTEEIDLDEAALLATTELLLGQPEMGTWLMAGLPFQMGTLEVDEADLERILASALEGGGGGAWPMDEHLKMALGLLRAEPRKGNETVYRLDSADQRVAVLSQRRGDRDFVIGGRLAKRGPGNRWTVVEVTAGSGIGATGTDRALMPLPAGARILARRQTSTGEALAQLTLLPGSLAEARQLWETKGWKTRKIKGWEEGTLVVCYKDGISISACAISEAKAGDPTALLLVRLPEPKGGSVSKGE